MAGTPNETGPIEGRWERIPGEGYTTTLVHVERSCEPFVAAPGQQPRCKEDRGGAFYTDCKTCLICDVPHAEAPSVMAYVVHPGERYAGWHCVFTRRPQTPDEIEQAINAMCSSEVCGIRY